MVYMNSVSLIGFVGADPEQRQARSNDSKFAVLFVATQRSWKNAQDDWSSKVEWHRVCIIWNQNQIQARTCLCLDERLLEVKVHAHPRNRQRHFYC